jgi:hypothetical protein
VHLPDAGEQRRAALVAVEDHRPPRVVEEQAQRREVVGTPAEAAVVDVENGELTVSGEVDVAQVQGAVDQPEVG